MEFTENLEYVQGNEAFWPKIAFRGFSGNTPVLQLNLFQRLDFFFVLALLCVLGNTKINLVVRISIFSVFFSLVKPVGIFLNP